MKLLPRKSSSAAETTETTAAANGASANGASANGDAVRGKGRPTPKRRESVAPRGPVTAPKTRKEAYARQKQLTRENRTAAAKPTAQQTPAERRAALRSGAILPARDQGPTRKLARDFVDSHRLASNYLLVVLVLMLLSWVTKVSILQLVAFAIFVGIVIEWLVLGHRIRKLARERFGRAEGSDLSIGFYAGSRAYLPRRWRMPAPQYKLGDKI